MTQYFRLSFGGKVSANIPAFVSAMGLEAIMEAMFDYGQLDVVVEKTYVATR